MLGTCKVQVFQIKWSVCSTLALLILNDPPVTAAVQSMLGRDSDPELPLSWPEPDAVEALKEQSSSKLNNNWEGDTVLDCCDVVFDWQLLTTVKNKEKGQLCLVGWLWSRGTWTTEVTSLVISMSIVYLWNKTIYIIFHTHVYVLGYVQIHSTWYIYLHALRSGDSLGYHLQEHSSPPLMQGLSSASAH